MQKRQSWLHKHPILTTIIIIFSLLIIFAIINNFIKNDSSSIQQNNQNIKRIQQDNTQQAQNPSVAWHEVINFIGVSDKTTDTFNIKGNKFRVTYLVNPANSYSGFVLYIYQPENEVYLDSLSLDSGKEASIIYLSPGEYYLKIRAVNLRNWSVKVEDYY